SSDSSSVMNQYLPTGVARRNFSENLTVIDGVADRFMHVALNDPASGTTRLSLNVPALPPGLSRAAPAMLLPSVPPSIWAPARALGLDASALAAMATLAGPNAQAIP